MFKRLAVVVMVLMFCVSAEALTDSYSYVSGSSIQISPTTVGTPVIRTVTFNSIIKRMMVRNRSTTDDVYMDIKGLDINDVRGGCSNPTVFLPIAGKATSETIVIDFATRNISFAPATTTGGSGDDDFVEYTIFSDVEIE